MLVTVTEFSARLGKSISTYHSHACIGKNYILLFLLSKVLVIGKVNLSGEQNNR